MILTSKKIIEYISTGDIVIDPFDAFCVDVNSYSFHLGTELIKYSSECIDPMNPPKFSTIRIPHGGYILEPDTFYLAATLERMGSTKCASELYANRSVASCGMFIQTSAPLGHTGAIINWTLEILAANYMKIYPGMEIGKICFWMNYGNITKYNGRYINSDTVVSTKISNDYSF